MKTTGHLVIFISEDEDFVLWRFLAQLPSDDRVAFIKSALNAALGQKGRQKNDSNHKNNSSLHDFGKADNFIDTLVRKKIEFDELDEIEEIAKPLLENYNSHKPKDLSNNESTKSTISEDNKLEIIELEDLFQTVETKPSTTARGLDFLLNNVIGEENDESIIAFIKNNKSPS